MYRKTPFLASCLSLLLAGCLRSSSTPFIGMGPLPLSATNPFIGANYFLGQQLSQGRFLRELFLLRGGPDAVEVVDSNSLQLFYLRHHQTYLVDQIGRYDESPEWVVRGPFVMSRRQYLTLKKLGIYPGAAPVFVVNGRLTNFRIPPTPTPLPTSTPFTLTKARSVRVRRASSVRPNRPVLNAPGAVTTGSYSKSGATINPNATPNSDQRALSAARPTPLSINLLEQILKGTPRVSTPSAEPAPASPPEPSKVPKEAGHAAPPTAATTPST